LIHRITKKKKAIKHANTRAVNVYKLYKLITRTSDKGAFM